MLRNFGWVSLIALVSASSAFAEQGRVVCGVGHNTGSGQTVDNNVVLAINSLNSQLAKFTGPNYQISAPTVTIHPDTGTIICVTVTQN